MRKIFTLLLIAISALSCSRESTDDGYSDARRELENSKLFKSIVNTTWKHDKTVTTSDSGKQNIQRSDAVITFTDEGIYDNGNLVVYYTNFNGHAKLGGWWIEDGEVLRFSLNATDYSPYYTPKEVGAWIGTLGVGGVVVRLTETNLTMKETYDYSEKLVYFIRHYGTNGEDLSDDEYNDGDDDDEGGYITCTWCKGTGECHACDGDGLWLGNAEICSYCDGSGVCEHCHGTGILEY